MSGPIEPIDPNGLTLDQLEAMAADYQAIAPKVYNAVQNLICELEDKVNQIDSLGSELTTLEETKFFKGLTEHSHQQLMLDWREYLCSLKEAAENLAKANNAVAVEKACREN
jgi:hypothetical protein